MCSVNWPFNGSEVADDPVLMQTSLLLLCESMQVVLMRTNFHLNEKSRERESPGKVNFSIARIHRPGNSAYSCAVGYYISIRAVLN